MSAPLESNAATPVGDPVTSLPPHGNRFQGQHFRLHLTLHEHQGPSRYRQKLRGVLIAPDLTEPARPIRGSTHLRRLLVELDALALIGAWLPLLLESSGGRNHARPSGEAHKIIAAVITTAVSLVFAAIWRLYQARVCKVKHIERALLFRLAVVSTIVAGVVLTQLHSAPSDANLVVFGTLAFVLLVTERTGYRAWLHAMRRRGRFTRSTIVIGTNDEALRWCKLYMEHPELGVTVCGVVGDENPAIAEANIRWLGNASQLGKIASDEIATSTLIIVTAFSPIALNKVTREALRAGLHVEMSTGLQGIAGERLRWVPVSRENLVYLEYRSLSKGALTAKRAFDIVVSLATLTVSLPILVTSAFLIKRYDHGPIFFRQERVGRNGKLFTLYKLRSMTPNAESIQKDLIDSNYRSGPLFKMPNDPRVTPIGRLLRLSSVDELPQLYNVLQGHMSLVGPRPALPSEVKHFDEDLLARHTVLPGITGLWQLDARDDVSFDAYRRLDLHYVENWSILLDVKIFVSTVASVFKRLLKKGEPTFNS